MNSPFIQDYFMDLARNATSGTLREVAFLDALADAYAYWTGSCGPEYREILALRRQARDRISVDFTEDDFDAALSSAGAEVDALVDAYLRAWRVP